MGRYFNPATELPKVARPLTGQDYNALLGQLKQDEVLIGLFDRLIFKLAPHLYSRDEFDAFDAEYRSGNIVGRDFYALPRAEYEKHVF